MTGARRAVIALATAAALSGASVLVITGAVDRTELQNEERAREGAVFGVLRNARTVRDDISLDNTSKMRTDPETKRAGVQWDESRHATTRLAISIYVLPARHGICMLLASPQIGTDLACASQEDAAAGRLLSRLVVNGSTIVAGLAPDSVDQVTVTTDVTDSVPVHNNAFILSAGTTDGRLFWTSANKNLSLPLPPAML